MKADNYNPRAREAFAKSLIDIGVGIFKGIMLLFTVAPLTFLLKIGADGKLENTWYQFGVFLMSPSYFVFLVFLALAFVVGNLFRHEGLRHLHEIEENEKNTSKT